MFEDENGNRPGDWMHKNQRTKESVNRIIKDPNAKKWYQETFWIVVVGGEDHRICAGGHLCGHSLYDPHPSPLCVISLY